MVDDNENVNSKVESYEEQVVDDAPVENHNAPEAHFTAEPTEPEPEPQYEPEEEVLLGSCPCGDGGVGMGWSQTRRTSMSGSMHFHSKHSKIFMFEAKSSQEIGCTLMRPRFV